jgi:hypothetical protein
MSSSKFEFTTSHPQLSEALQAKCLERATRDGNVRGYLLIHEMQGQGLAIKDKIISKYLLLLFSHTPFLYSSLSLLQLSIPLSLPCPFILNS